jgi:hypothetical protein
MKYVVNCNVSVGPEDMEAGRCYEVVHRQAWDSGRYLPAVASLCTRPDAEMICQALNGDLLRTLVNVLNSRGNYGPGGCDFNTEEGAAYRAAVDFLNR